MATLIAPPFRAMCIEFEFTISFHIESNVRFHAVKIPRSPIIIYVTPKIVFNENVLLYIIY